MEVKVPVSILDEIETLAPRSTKRKKWLTKLMALAVYHYEMSESSPHDHYLHWSATYIEQVTTNHFYRWFANQWGYQGEVQMEDRLLQHDGLFKIGRKTLHYRIRPDLLLEANEVKAVEVDIEADNLNGVLADVVSHYESTCNFLRLNESLMEEYLENLISPVLVPVGDIYAIAKDQHQASWLSREVVTKSSFKKVSLPDGVQYFDGQKNLDYLRGIVRKRGFYEDIVICDSDVHIGQRNRILSQKTEQSRFAARKKIQDVASSQDRCVISSSNGRMNTYLTNLNTALLPFLSIDFQHIDSYDMRASQPTILANILTGAKRFLDSLRASEYAKLKEYVDVISPLCCQDTWKSYLDTLMNKDLYESLGKEMGVSRAEAKHLSMVALFRKDTRLTSVHRALNRIHPEVGTGIVKVKQVLNEAFPEEKSPLSLFLQMTEAHIFVSGILRKLARKGLHCFTRHDSILFADRPENYSLVCDTVQAHLNSIAFEGRFSRFTYWHHPEYDPWYLGEKKYLYDQTEHWEWDAEQYEKEREMSRLM